MQELTEEQCRIIGDVLLLQIEKVTGRQVAALELTFATEDGEGVNTHSLAVLRYKDVQALINACDITAMQQGPKEAI